MTCYQEITCPSCKSNQIGKSGRSATGEPRYRCRNPVCLMKTFMLNDRYRACQAGIKEQVVEMAINGSGIRDTVRVLKINKNTITRTLKKANTLCRFIRNLRNFVLTEHWKSGWKRLMRLK